MKLDLDIPAAIRPESRVCAARVENVVDELPTTHKDNMWTLGDIRINNKTVYQAIFRAGGVDLVIASLMPEYFDRFLPSTVDQMAMVAKIKLKRATEAEESSDATLDEINQAVSMRVYAVRFERYLHGYNLEEWSRYTLRLSGIDALNKSPLEKIIPYLKIETLEAFKSNRKDDVELVTAEILRRQGVGNHRKNAKALERRKSIALVVSQVEEFVRARVPNEWSLEILLSESSGLHDSFTALGKFHVMVVNLSDELLHTYNGGRKTQYLVNEEINRRSAKPKRFAECLQRYNEPCPWYSCRHHVIGDEVVNPTDYLYSPVTCSLKFAIENDIRVERSTLGEVFGVTGERIRQIEEKALSVLRAQGFDVSDFFD